MDRPELPDKVVRIDILRVNWNCEKICQCHNPHYVLDVAKRAVYCDDCKATIDPFEALVRLASSYSRASDQVERLLEQRRQIEKYRPHLVVIKRLEEMYRGRRMVPTCPECHQPFDLSDLLGAVWTNRAFLRAKRGGNKDADGC